MFIFKNEANLPEMACNLEQLSSNFEFGLRVIPAMSYCCAGEYTGLGQLSAVPSAHKYICGTENGEIVTIDGHGGAEAVEASEDPHHRGSVRKQGQGSLCYGD